MIIPNPVRAVIFDLDGTLMNTAGEIDAALARTFDSLGVARLPRANVEALIGKGVRSLLERALAHQGAAGVDLDAAVERFESDYAALVATEADLFPGVREGLDMLRAAGILLGVVTNKPRLFTERLLESAEVHCLFAAIVAGDDGIRRKPAGDMLLAACSSMGSEPAATLMMGDSDNDVIAARAAGCPVWCVPYGYNEGRAPGTLAADRMVKTVDEAARLLTGER